MVVRKFFHNIDIYTRIPNQTKYLKICFVFLTALSVVGVVLRVSVFQMSQPARFPLFRSHRVVPDNRHIQHIVSAFKDFAVYALRNASLTAMTSYLNAPSKLTVRSPNCTKYYHNNGTRKDVQPKAGTLFQCVGSPGRLGNALFTYASSLGVAALTNRTMVVEENNPLIPFFKLRAVVNCDRKLCVSPTFRLDTGCCVFQPRILIPEPDTTKYLKVGVYLQSWRYFQHVQQDLREQYKAYGPTAERASAVFRRIREGFEHAYGAVTLVGVHIRRGDILSPQMKHYGYQLPSQGYFRRAMMWFRQKYRRVAFVISSNNEKHATRNVWRLCQTETKTNEDAHSSLKNHTHHYQTSTAQKVGKHFSQHAAIDEGMGINTTNTENELSNLSSRNASTLVLNEKENSESARSGSILPSTKTYRRLSNVDGETRRGSMKRTAPILKEHSRPSAGTEGGRCHYVGSDNAAVDLTVLAHCDHFIMSVGTFGWWAAWLTGGTVIYYRHPARKGSPYRQVFNYQDVYPPHWIPMA